ncbi:MAG: hypothetical protein EVG15_04200 [Candidatus Acididesulfobacter diazotrophicus]|uniref:PASTA domain-containing protein n=1 Tax=Candidatus Acididesulfobacter diazotrophicus TaxID=2597226 RepID=A0A519BNE7_9DELT|nr:MAG: hypothetical protein EVG15_04200 [Candidatus Acididesulfobacter diazotrophicus]
MNKIWKTTMKVRILIVFSLIFIFGGLLLIKAFYLQVIDAPQLRKMADVQFHTKIYFTPKRGNIYSANGGLLATSINEDGIAIDPLMIKHKYKVSKELSQLLNIKLEKVISKLNLNLQFTWLKKKVSSKTADKIENLGIDGISIVKQPVRYYPDGDILAHVLGFVGINDNGLSGIEYKYNKILKGNEKALQIMHDGLGQDIFIRGFGLEKETHGDNIYLTINKKLQYITEHYLDKEAKAADSRGAFAIIMNPNTGAILAMADYPAFNPNYYWKYKPRYWRNRAVTDDFEPGSTMKPFIISGAMQDGVIKPTTIVNGHHGAYYIDGITVHDVGTSFGHMNINQLIEYSCNVCACQVGMKLGKERLYYWLKRWGFLSKPHAGLLGESSGIDRPVSKWSHVGSCEEAFGQGAAITGLQEITALSAIANGGFLMKPYIIKKIVNPYGKVLFISKPKVIRRVINSKTDREMKYMMRLVVKGGTGQYCKLIDYKVSGKTGTGQIADPKTGKYYKNLYTASFMAFVPYKHPKLAMLVVQEKPLKISYYGGAVSAPVVREVFKRALNILNIFPGNKAYKKQVHIMSLNNLPIAANSVKNNINKKIHKIGIMPNLHGDTILSAIKDLVEYDKNITIKGTGFLYYQNIKPGTKIKKNQVILLKFKPLL